MPFNEIFFLNNSKLSKLYGRLALFFLLLLSQILFLLLLYINIYVSLLLFFEFVFLFFVNKLSLKRIFRIVIIALLIFVINLIRQEGQILFRFYFFVVTKEGLLLAYKKSVFLLLLMMHILNTVNLKKETIVSLYLKNTNKQGLIIQSIIYFMEFFNRISEKTTIKGLYKTLIETYKKKSFSSDKDIHKNMELFTKQDIIYFLLFYSIIVISFGIKYIIKYIMRY